MNNMFEYNENNYHEFEWFDGLAVIRFYAEWCAPCTQNFPVFEQLAQNFAKSHPEIKFGIINIDQSPILTLRYNVYGLPSTLIFQQGQIIQRIAGVKTLMEYSKILQAHT
ncbi:thioredoxin family protein [Acinetobacter sp. R933-2]|uniref:thioredoxin family protein n=1 Tax=Acinetobacter sp. R933-2 TaxID=2746728 RepID=UPI002574BC44|nr:thioredoxin family protein [Acinetobacter sp. R933-2]MDM1246306.1 thioredoxin family protein [Acinetobacter sp. R933-2]